MVYFFFNLLCSKNILTKLVRYQQPTCLCIKMEFVETFRFLVNCIHFRTAVFVHVGSAQLCTENGVSFYMCCRSCMVSTEYST